MKWVEISERERSAWLAKNVMGWQHHSHMGTLVWCDVNAEGECLIIAHDEERTAGLRVLDSRSGDHLVLGFLPTTNTAAAMLLAEKMREKHWAVTLKLMPSWIVREGYSVGLLRAAGQRIIIAGNTLPEAIAHACFVALGGEK